MFNLLANQPQIFQKKLQKLERGPQTPQQDLLNAAFRVFNNREDEAKQEK
jgi:hypothetical protein